MGRQEDQKTDNQKIERHRTNDKHFMLCNTHALLRISFVSFFGVFFGGWVGKGMFKLTCRFVLMSSEEIFRNI